MVPLLNHLSCIFHQPFSPTAHYSKELPNHELVAITAITSPFAGDTISGEGGGATARPKALRALIHRARRSRVSPSWERLVVAGNVWALVQLMCQENEVSMDTTGSVFIVVKA